MKIRAWSLCLVLGLVLLTTASAEQAQETQTATAKDVPVLSEIGSSLQAKLNSLLSMGDSDDLDFETPEEKQKKQQALLQAQQKAYYDGYMNAFNAMRFQQQMAQQAAHRRRRLQKRHQRHVRLMQEKRHKKAEEHSNKQKSEENSKQQAAKARSDMDELFGAPKTDNVAGVPSVPSSNNNNDNNNDNSNNNDDSNNNSDDNNNNNNNDDNNNSNNNDDNNNDDDAPVHHHHRHHHRRRHTLQAYPYASPSTFFQQYYAHPALGGAMPFYGQPAAADHHHHHHHHRHHHDDDDRDNNDKDNDNNNNDDNNDNDQDKDNNNNDDKNDNNNNNNDKQNDQQVGANQMRFRESFQSGQHYAYGDPYNSRISSGSQMSAYGPPMENPDAALSAPAFPPAPHEQQQQLQQHAVANLNLNAAMFHPNMAPNARNTAAMMRFSQAPAAPAAPAGGQAAGNQANPGGVPMPFYPPTAPPPPAPNQIPMSPASVNGVFPENFQIESTADIPMAAAGMTQSPGANPAAQVMGPNQPNAEVNNYPFSF